MRLAAGNLFITYRPKRESFQSQKLAVRVEWCTFVSPVTKTYVTPCTGLPLYPVSAATGPTPTTDKNELKAILTPKRCARSAPSGLRLFLSCGETIKRTTKNYTWPTSLCRKCVRLHEIFLNTVDNVHRKSLPADWARGSEQSNRLVEAEALALQTADRWNLIV